MAAPPPKSESQAIWLPSDVALVPEKFSRKFKLAGKQFLQKNVGCIMEAKPGQAYKVLKRMRPRSGDYAVYGGFKLAEYVSLGLSAEQCADRLARAVTIISQEFHALKASPSHPTTPYRGNKPFL